MNRIWIGNAERRLEDADPQWIHEQLGARQQDGASTCVRVEIHTAEADLALATANCPKRRGAQREATQLEASLLDLWERCHLKGEEFTGGNVVSFVQQVRRLV